jgi:hypothetical protein
LGGIEMEDKIKIIYTLQEKHGIECLVMLADGCSKWKDFKSTIKENKLYLSDGTYRKLMNQFCELGLATKHFIDPIKFSYKITDSGKQLADKLKEILY